ncbi:MAG: hypothetical protein HC894_04285 [Microcoleus sp. SM1_3_4]|nr:hypothetical protein [Microcoleus sp. SM1_3_4]
MPIALFSHNDFACPEFLRAFLEGKSDLPQSLLRAIEPSAETFFHASTTSPAMQIALHQILHCPYEGRSRKFILKARPSNSSPSNCLKSAKV